MSDKKENLSSVLSEAEARPTADAETSETPPETTGTDQSSSDNSGSLSEAEDGPAKRERRRTHSARRARQGQVVLDSPLKKATFFGGLAGIVLLILLLSLFGVIS